MPYIGTVAPAPVHQATLLSTLTRFPRHLFLHSSLSSQVKVRILFRTPKEQGIIKRLHASLQLEYRP